MEQEQVLRFSVLIFKVLGAWGVGKRYRAYRCLLLAAVVIFFASSFREIIANKLSSETFTNAYALINCLNGVVKLVMLCRKKRLIEELFRMLESASFQPQNERQKGIAERARRASMVAFFTFLAMGNLLVGMWIFRPVLERKRELPVEAWYPFDYQEYYVPSYLWQGVNYFVMLQCIVSVDVFFVLTMIRLGVQCDFLLDSIERLGNDSIFADVIAHHQDILKFSSKIQELYSNIILIQFLSSIVFICTTLFLLNLAKIFSTNFFVFLICLSFMLTQVWLYCRYGDDVIQKSENFQTVAFGSDWYSWPEESKKKLLFFIHRTREPIAVLTGNIYPTNLPVFVEILRRSWAFFMTLRSMQNNEPNN